MVRTKTEKMTDAPAATTTPQQPLPETPEVKKGKEVATKQRSRSLAEQLKVRGVTDAQWFTLTGSIFPGAKPASILLAVDYCRARGLDVLKKPCHIVPMDVKNAETGRYETRDVVLPGIYELRTTAHRTGLYMGHSKIEYGPLFDFEDGTRVPESASMTVKRWTEHGVAEFPTEVMFLDVCGTRWDNDKKTNVLNSKWRKSPRQMLDKCLEAAALRKAFPEDIGGQYVPEEVEVETIAPAAAANAPQADMFQDPRQTPEVPERMSTGDVAADMNDELGLDDEPAQQSPPAASTPPEDDQKPM